MERVEEEVHNSIRILSKKNRKPKKWQGKDNK